MVTASSPSHQARSCGVCANVEAAANTTPVRMRARRFAARRAIGNSIACGGQPKSCAAALSFVRQRMQVAHEALEALVEHMGVDLCRGDVGMAQQSLYDPKIGAVVQEMTGEGVAEHVRAHLCAA